MIELGDDEAGINGEAFAAGIIRMKWIIMKNSLELN